MKLDLTGNTLKLEYPCAWTYKLIGHDAESVKKAVSEVVVGRENRLALSNKSKTGKYFCLNLELIVYTEEERNSLFSAFKKHQSILMVL
ncbi:MAG: DUF493 domain-containing protein [Nitrospinota bacterium]